MPTTSPDNIYYADTATTSNDVAVSAAEASSVQAAFSQRQIRSFKWANQAARLAQTGMSDGDMGEQLDIGQSFQYVASASLWLPESVTCRLLHTATLTAPGSFTALPIPWNTEEEDLYNMHNNTNPSRLTAIRSGLYQINTAYLGSTNVIWGLELRLNGTLIPGSRRWTGAIGGGLGTPSTSKTLRLSVGQYVEVYYAASAAGTVETTLADARPSVDITRIGD